MKRANHRLTLLSAGLLAILALAQGAFGQTGYLVTVNTSSLSGQTGNIDLQFDAGALSTENACAAISNFSISSPGSLGSPATTTGSVTGRLATSLTINNGSSGCSSPTATNTSPTFNDYNQPITFGSTLSFYVTLNGPGVTAPAGNTNGNSGSSFGVAFTVADPATAGLTGDPSNFAGTIVLNPDGTVTTTDLPGPGNTSSLVTIKPAELVTVGTSPTGLAFTVDSNPYTASQTFAWAIGDQQTLTAITPQGSNGTRYVFSQWSDGTNTAADTITVSTNTTTYTANFNTSYLLTTAVSPSSTDGSVGVNPASPTSDGYYAAGTPVTLTATANIGYTFSNWTGTTSSTSNPLMVTMNSPVSETANFALAPTFTITPNPESETVNRGNIAAFILNLKSVSGFSGIVKLSCSGGPAGSYCVDFPMIVHLKGTANAASGIFFPRNTTPGTYTIKFTGVSGSLTNTATAKFTVKVTWKGPVGQLRD